MRKWAAKFPVLFAIAADVIQFVIVALLLCALLIWLRGYSPLDPARFATLGAIFGAMKSLARAFNCQWTEKLPIWRRVTDEHFVSLCFVIALPLAAQVTPAKADLGSIKIKKPASGTVQPGLTWQEKVNRFHLKTIGAISYALRETPGWILLACSLAVEALVLGAKRLVVWRWRAARSPG